MRSSTLPLILAGLVWVFSGPLADAATLRWSDLRLPQPAGTTVTFSIGGAGGGQERYRLRIERTDGLATQHLRKAAVIYDYSPDNRLRWTPLDPGSYRVSATVRDRETGQESSVQRRFTVTSAAPRAMTYPVGLATDNPLVALYVAPPCPAWASMQIRFFPRSGGSAQTTSPKPCNPGTQLHFYVAGMRENTTYLMQPQLLSPNGAIINTGSLTSFPTGAADIPDAPGSVTVPYNRRASLAESVIWVSPIHQDPALGLNRAIQARDLEGRLIWYLDEDAWALRPAAGGALWYVKADPYTGIPDNVLVKADLLGNVLRQTNVESLNDQLARLGYTDRINDIHHDARELPNGDIAIISTVERLVTDIQGSGQVDVLGDMIIVMSQDLEIQWVWNGWDHLDPTRLATGGEVCTIGGIGCQPFFLASQANDWMHANALSYTADGNLILSVRNQDWILKINYAGGAGDGRILWRLGPDGDFTLQSGNGDDWFSHMHDPNFVSENRIALFDNSNLRCGTGTPDCHSRGQVWEIDENAMTARLVLNKDLGSFAYAVGTAQKLLNGNYWFNVGMVGTLMDPQSNMQEVTPDGTTVYRIEDSFFQYRAFRMSDLYTPPTDWNSAAGHRRAVNWPIAAIIKQMGMQ